MVRDKRKVTETVHVYRHSMTGVQTGDLTFPHVSLDQERGDAVSTPREGDGSHVRPTNYYGRFFKSSNNAFSYRYGSPLAWNTRSGKSALAQYSNVLDAYYGCYSVSGYPDVSGSLLNAVDSIVRHQMMGGNWNLGQSLAELPESIDFLFESVLFVTRALRALRELRFDRVYFLVVDYGLRVRTEPADAVKWVRRMRRDRKRLGREVLRGSAKGWLAYQFAILPVLNDIYSALELIENGMTSPNSFRAFAEQEEPLDGGTSKSGTYTYALRWSGKRGVKVECAYKIRDSHLYTLSSFGILSPAGLAWELLPLSFVLDWFVPVGNFLSAIGKPLGLTFDWGYRTTYCAWSVSARYAFSPPEDLLQGANIPQIEGNLFSFRRATYLGPPVPVPYFRGLDKLTSGKITSLTALLFAR